MNTTGGVLDPNSDGHSEVHSYLAEDDTMTMWDDDVNAEEKKEQDLYALVRSVVIKKKCYTLGTLSKEFPHISPSILQSRFMTVFECASHIEQFI